MVSIKGCFQIDHISKVYCMIYLSITQLNLWLGRNIFKETSQTILNVKKRLLAWLHHKGRNKHHLNIGLIILR